ncbi:MULTISPECIES: alpha/beta hydrolase family protein [unclassified Streptomyces]|uniref:alpha/beta hydrolase family protein n=1 Tax=unclassified Streptomyces TaxID=2593676 RepID=UPI00382A95FC
MNRIRRTAAAAVLALALPLPIAGVASAAPGPSAAPSSAASHAFSVPELPRPTGPHAVGRSTLHLVDRHRQDPWVPAAGARQLMVSMYYPARPGTGGPAPYMTTEEARLFLQEKAPGAGLPPELLSGTRTWARADARPAPGRFPLVLLSPGNAFPRASLTGLAEDLASRGYVVALVDHTYESPGVTFPDGRTLTCVTCDRPPAGGLEAMPRSRAKDISFVIGQLTDRHSAWPYAHLIDRRRIGMAGHSIGGDAAAVTMAGDERVRAGVNLDGTFREPNPAAGLHGRPFLLFGAQGDENPGMDTTWDTAWANLDGWKRRLTVAGAGHGSFTDVPLLAAAAGLPNSYALSAERSEEITRDYVGAFFDLHLKGVAQPLFDGASPANPEVTVQRP